jgi:hypothetical protein
LSKIQQHNINSEIKNKSSAMDAILEHSVKSNIENSILDEASPDPTIID